MLFFRKPASKPTSFIVQVLVGIYVNDQPWLSNSTSHFPLFVNSATVETTHNSLLSVDFLKATGKHARCLLDNIARYLTPKSPKIIKNG